MKTDVTPLMWAAVLNNAEVAQALLDAKVDAAARTEKRMFGPGAALDIAVNHDRTAVRGILLSEFLQRDEWASRLEAFARSASERLGRSNCMLGARASLPGESAALLVDTLMTCGLLTALPESVSSRLGASSDVRLAYFGRLCATVAWQVNPLSEEKVCVSEACVDTVTEHLPGRRPSRGSVGVALREVGSVPYQSYVSASAIKLNDSLRATFPLGIPPRLLVIGSGGSGKTLLAQKILLESCRASLDELEFSPSIIPFCVSPFRVSLSSLSATLGDEQRAWAVVELDFSEAFGAESAHVQAVQRVRAEGDPALVVADGFDEVQGRNARETERLRRMVLKWIGTFDSASVCVVVTSRPAAVEAVREAFGRLGFVAHRVLPLTGSKATDLLDKLAGRLGLAGAEKDSLIRVVGHPEYRSLAQVPFTLTLLAKVLASGGASEGVVSTTAVYDSTLQHLLRDALRKSAGMRDVDNATEVSLRELLGTMAFWNHLSGAIAQPWSSCFFLGAGVAVVQTWNLSVLPGSAASARFMHLSFQEYLSAELLAHLLSGGTAELGAWLQACAGDSWWSQVLLMTFEIISPSDQRSVTTPSPQRFEAVLATTTTSTAESRSVQTPRVFDALPQRQVFDALLDTLATDRQAQLHEGKIAKLSYHPSAANGTKIGMTYPVVVQELTVTHATVRRVRDVERKEKPLTVPIPVVKLPAAGTGVLLLAAARAGTTELTIGLVRHGVHIGIIDSWNQTALHLSITGSIAMGNSTTNALLEEGADVNSYDSEGTTPLHIAARQQSLAIVTSLLKYAADCSLQDEQGRCPAHVLPLSAGGYGGGGRVLELFDLLAPSRGVLALMSRTGVSVLERFASWAATATDDEGSPFAPAQARLRQLRAVFPDARHGRASDIQLPASAGDVHERTEVLHEVATRAFPDLQPGPRFQLPASAAEVQERTEEYTVEGRCVPVPCWQAAVVEVQVVWAAFAIAPWSMHRCGVDVVAGSFCGERKAALFAIPVDSEAMPHTAFSSLESLHSALLVVVAALPLNASFMLVDESFGAVTPVLWPLAPRLAGVLLINFGLYFSDEHLASEAFAQHVAGTTSISQLFKNHDAEKMASIGVGAFVYCVTDEDAASSREIYFQAMRGAVESYWSIQANTLVHYWQTAITDALRDLAPLEGLRGALACGAFSPAVAVQESSRRFQRLLPGSTLTYIPKSKVWWFVEGKEPCEAVAALLHEVVARAFPE